MGSGKNVGQRYYCVKITFQVAHRHPGLLSQRGPVILGNSATAIETLNVTSEHFSIKYG